MDDVCFPDESNPRESLKKTYGIYPYNPLRKLWEYIMYFASLSAIWETFYVWFFDFELDFVWIIPTLVIDVLYLVDIFIVTRTGVLHYGVMKLDKVSIISSISKWKMGLYWISPWPYYLIGYFFQNLLVYRILLCLKYIRVVRLYNARSIIRCSLPYINAFSKMLMLFTTLFTIVHVFACIFWFIGHVELPGESWLNLTEVLDEPEMIQYFHSVYYITTTILTIGYGDIHPVTFPEIIVVIIIEGVGVFFYNFLVSNMVSIVADPSRNAFLSKYQRIYNAFKWRGVSKESRKELLRYYEYVWDKSRNTDGYYETSNKMPESLQKRISVTLQTRLFNNITAFRESDQKMLEEVALSLKPRIFTPGDFIIKAGRVSNKIYFVTEGKIDVLNPTGSFIASFDGKNICVLGETSVIYGTEEVTCSIAETYVEAFELSKESIESIPGLHDRFVVTDHPTNRPAAGNHRNIPANPH